jgi:hypothetical protein
LVMLTANRFGLLSAKELNVAVNWEPIEKEGEEEEIYLRHL